MLLKRGSPSGETFPRLPGSFDTRVPLHLSSGPKRFRESPWLPQLLRWKDFVELMELLPSQRAGGGGRRQPVEPESLCLASCHCLLTWAEAQLPPQFLKLGCILHRGATKLNAHTIRRTMPLVQSLEAWFSDMHQNCLQNYLWCALRQPRLSGALKYIRV